MLAPRWKPAGVALLVTMAILLLLTIFVTEFFFETNLETQAMRNFNSSFQARSAAKSMFQIILRGMQLDDARLLQQLAKQRGMVKNLMGGGSQAEATSTTSGLLGLQAPAAEDVSILNPPTDPFPLTKDTLALAGMDLDIEDNVIIFMPYIRPIDHLFNLNRIQPSGKTRGGTLQDSLLLNEFLNIISKIDIIPPKDEWPDPNRQPEPKRLKDQDIMQIYGAFFDWMDFDQEVYSDKTFGQLGAEDSIYRLQKPEYMIKNRGLDRLSELLLIEGVVKSQIPFETWNKYFTVYPVGFADESGEISARINPNFANKSELIEFLKQRDQGTAFLNQKGDVQDPKWSTLKDFVEHAEDVANALTVADGNNKRISFATNEDISKAIQSYGATKDLKFAAKEFFIAQSIWYEIQVIAEVDGIQAKLQALVKMPRDEKGKVNPQGVAIMDFTLN